MPLEEAPAALPGEAGGDAARVRAMAAYLVPDADIAAAVGITEAELATRYGRLIAETRAVAKAQAGRAMLERATKGTGRDADRAAEAFLRLNGVPGPGEVARPAAPPPANEAAPPAAPAPGLGPDVTCNFEEMAEKLGVSKPTLREWINRWDGFPVLARGSNGVAWSFDPRAVVAFVAQKRQEEDEANKARAELLGQIALPFEEPKGGGTLDLVEMRQLYTIARQADELGVARGRLLRVADLRPPLWDLLTRWRLSCLALPRKWGNRHNLPPAVVAELRRDLEEWLTEIHAGAREILTEAAVPEMPSDDEASATAA